VLSGSIPLVLVALLHPALAARLIGPTPALQIKRFARVNESYYRGAEPRRQADYEGLASLGIQAVIDLKHEGIATESTIVRQLGMRFYSIPISSSSAPSDDAVARFLKLVADPANAPVFVHCVGGHDRTGALTAIYRMTHDGWTADRAYREMRRYGYDGTIAGSALKEFVFNYARRLAHQTR
jgi:protein tyrosine/serine phosphatase